MTVPRPVPAQALPHRAEITSSGALWRSTVFPGWGQRYKGEKKKGWILTGTAVGLLAATVGAVINEQRAHSSYERLTTTNRADYDAAYSRELQAQLVADLAGGATLLLWGGNIDDSAFTPIEQIRVKDAKIQDVLPAMQKFYETNPVLSIVLENRSSEPVSKVKVRFEAKDIMDLPAESETVESIPGGIAKSLAVTASFNKKIFEIGASEPKEIPARITVVYESGSRKREFTQTATFTVYNRNAIIWDDMRRLSAFVTPRDETVKTFASAVLTKKIAISQVKQISTAAALFDAMSAYGITYVSDPATPFSTFHGNSVAVDTVNYPTDTLRRKTGDCDDLTSLYASLLESAGISTALVDVPGHVFVLFDSGMKPEEMKNLTGSDTAYLARNGSAWIPVEITALGAPFTRAWTLGSAEVRKWSGLKQFHLVETFSSQETYPPSPPDFPTPPAGFPRLDGNRLAALTREDASRLGRSQDGAEQKAVAAIRARHLPPAAEANEIGIIYAKDGRLDEAKESFLRARDLDPKLAKVYNNLANIACLQNDFAAAKKQYEDALAAAGESPAILINLATLYFDQGDAKQARLYFERALKFDPAYEADYPEIAALLHSDAAVDGTAIAVGEKKATGVQKAANEMERDPRRTRWMP